MSGGAQAKQRRSITAKELAQRLGSSERTARRLIAEPRDEFLERAEVRRKRVVGLREQGMKYREIAEEMGISTGAVGRILHDARKLKETKAPARGVGEFHGSGLTGAKVPNQP
ncbi:MULTISPECIES: helix-turn-helix domain-containing protein [unclassified Rhodococcus (in: high G+C Gram-positive bacteria)]|uniref:RNA polymerase sigma factor n=1 Tax=Rhodococcus sp. SJ-3 TaxID=3454628 RepID=UPI003F797E85